MGSRKDVWRESAVLLVTGISFLGLLGAGVFFWNSGGLAGEAALARLSGEVANSVAVEWSHLRRDGAWFEGDLERWSAQPGPAPVAVHVWPEQGENLVAEALLSEAGRLRASLGESERALEILLDLLKKSPTDQQLANARLQIIQLAVLLNHPQLARQTLAEVQGSLHGAEGLEGNSLLMLASLAAAPVLSDSAKLALRADLVARWQGAQLALPAQTLNGDPLRAAFAAALQALVTEGPPDMRLARAEQSEHARLLAKELGGSLPVIDGAGLMVQRIGEQELLYRQAGPALLEGRFFPARTCIEALAKRVQASSLLPEGFQLDWGADETPSGILVRDWTPLEHLTQGFRLLHLSPAEFRASVEGRQRWLSAGFCALALGLLAAGIVVVRSIRRERNLARLKSLFVANVSHELRTPVASILLMAENLEAGRIEDPASRQRYHRLIRLEADRLRRLVNDVLDFSRIERGKSLQLMMGKLDLQSFGKELRSEASERVGSKGGELTFQQDAQLATIGADGDALRRATMNLVENALRHSGQLDVSIQLSSDQAGGLLIEVADLGCGVPASRLETLFEPFERVEDAEDERTAAAGTGLGLAIVREIAESHGGEVSARNNSPTGFAVQVQIPAQSPAGFTMEANEERQP